MGKKTRPEEQQGFSFSAESYESPGMRRTQRELTLLGQAFAQLARGSREGRSLLSTPGLLDKPRSGEPHEELLLDSIERLQRLVLAVLGV